MATDERPVTRFVGRALTWVLAGVGVLALGLAGWEYQAASSLSARFEGGRTAKGRVTDLVGGPTRRAHSVSYEYTVEGASHSASRRSITYADWKKLKPGAAIDVFYDPAGPGRCVSESEREYVTSGWFMNMVVGLVAAGFFLSGAFVWSMVRASREARGRDPGPVEKRNPLMS